MTHFFLPVMTLWWREVIRFVRQRQQFRQIGSDRQQTCLSRAILPMQHAMKTRVMRLPGHFQPHYLSPGCVAVARHSRAGLA